MSNCFESNPNSIVCFFPKFTFQKYIDQYLKQRQNKQYTTEKKSLNQPIKNICACTLV